ncbi:MAG: hypothetical protein U1D99_03645 [Candidatus Omnitrophota bacterium]|nr:hypothetical protein [Candidatus Omnitrophota bacterium]
MKHHFRPAASRNAVPSIKAFPFVFTFVLLSFSFVSSIHAEKIIKGSAIQEVSGESAVLKGRQIGPSRGGDLGGTGAGIETGRGLQFAGQGESPAPSFKSGIDETAETPWSEWNQPAMLRSFDPYGGFKQIAHEPSFRPGGLNDFAPQEADDQVLLFDKMNGLAGTIIEDVQRAEELSNVVPADRVNAMLDAVDGVYAPVDQAYGDIDAMYNEIDTLYKTLDQNYAGLDQYESITPEIASGFNAASDAMAERVAGMGKAVGGMINKVESQIQDLDGLLAAVDHMAKDGNAAMKFCDELMSQIDAATKQHQLLAQTLEKQNPYDYFPGELSQDPAVFKDQKDYLKDLKDYIQKSELKQIDDVRKYITEAKAYLEKVLKDLESTKANLKETEDYFRKAKVGDDLGGRGGIEMAPEGGESNACTEDEEVQGLDTLQNCAKSCRTVCRWKKKGSDGSDCYECPSGSPDTCYDLTPPAWPADHPWCQPGGICHSDPMLYCSPFGATGPNLEPLQCTNCKQRPDMCWQKAGGGMTYTNCKLGCWNGTCVFKGKYQEFEWDGTLEWVHCYECKTPPPPPTCEELGWGYDWEADCKKNCPDPGKCEEVNKKVGGKPPAPPAGGPPAGGPPGGGQPGGAQAGGGQPADGGKEGGDTTSSGGDEGGGPDGQKPNPPTGTPEQPGGGGGQVAGGEKEPEGQEAQPQQQDGTQERPQQPKTDPPEQPDKPKVNKPEVTEGNPPSPPDNAEIQSLKTRIRQTEEIIEDREEIISDPREGDGTKAEAARQKEAYEKELADLQERLRQEELEELERQRKALEEEQRQAEAQRQRDATRTRWPDPAEEMRKIRLKELKDAIDQLNQRAREIKEQLGGRREHVDRLDREIGLIEREIQHHKDAKESGATQERHADEAIKKLEAQLKHKKWLRDQLNKQLQEAQRQANEELEKLRKTYLKKLYAVDERARRQEEANRIDEFYSLWEEREHIKASRDERNRAFEEKFKQMEDEIAAAKARGDDETAERLQEELDNMKRGKEDWDKNYESRLKNVEERMYQTGHHDNFDDGVGPIDDAGLVSKLDEYGKIIDNEIAATERRIAELEQQWKEGKIGTSVRADGSEHVVELDNLRSKLEQLKGNRDGITEKLDAMKNGYQLPEDIAANIQNSTERYTEGSKTRGEDKSFARLFAESLAEEAAHNLRPDVALKKSVNFGIGLVEGIGSAVKDLAVLGAGAIDLTIEMHLTNLGFDVETDSFDKLNSMLTTVGENANFDGIIKATVALGGAIDKKLKEIERSGDIDAATARAGGQVGGMVIGEVLTDKGLGALGTVVGLGDDAVDAGRVIGKADDVADAGRAGTRARSGTSGVPDTTPVETPDVLKPPKTPDAPPSTAGAGSRPRGTPDAPDGPTVRTPDDGPAAPGTRPRGDRPDAPDRPDSTRPRADGDKPPDAPPPPRIPDPDAPKPKPADDIADGAADAGKVDDAAPPPREAAADAPPKQTPDPEPPAQPGPAAKADDVPPAAKVEPPPARAPPPPPKAYDNARPLPDAPPAAGKKPTQLTDGALDAIEKKQGFRKDHAQRMHEFAQDKDSFLLVRDGNPDSVKYFGDADKVPKPMSSKAKTAKVGPDQGLVVDPTHAKQAAEWDLAIKKAAAKAVKTGDFTELNKLKAAHQKALKSWADYGEDMLQSGYKVDPDTGRVLMKTTDANGNEIFKAVHGDYDLHGVYRKAPDGSMEHVSFGEGNKFDANGVDTSGGNLRNQLNDKISGGDKDFIQHGGQDDWIPDPDHVPVKPPDPPVTVFFPDGRPPVRLTTKAEMQDFYENVMGVQWPYKSVDNAAGAAGAAMKASDDALKAGGVVTDAVPSSPKGGLSSGAGSAQSPPKAGSILDDDIKTAIDAPGSSPAAGSATQKFDDVLQPPGSATQKFDDVLQPPGSGTQKFDDVLQPPGSGTQKFDDVLKAPDAGTPPRAGIPPNSSTTIKGPDGKPMTLNVGDELGHGSTSTVFADATDPKKAIRITEPGKGGITEAVKLDQAGRKAVQNVQKPGGPIRIVEEGKPVTVKDPNSPLNGKVVEVVERLPEGSADKMLPSQGGKLSDGQAKAFIDATEELNKSGYAWLDNHTGNYGFEKIEGTTDEWRVVVLDPGGIVPMKGKTLAERADNARALQTRINVHEEGTTEFIKSASDGMKQNFAKAERGEIMKEFGDKINTDAMKIKDPKDIAFYPLGTAELPEIQKLAPR